MVIDTTDVRSHGDEQILKAADFLAGSEVKQIVFEEIYRTKNSGKTAKEIARNILLLKNRSINIKQILDTARSLDGHGYVEVNKSKGQLTFVKVAFFSLNKSKILHLVRNEAARERFRAKVYGRPNTTLKIKKPNIRLPNQKTVTKQAKKGASRMSAGAIEDNWDVFICYKRISGEDFAKAVKKILEECHVHAFLDVKDIPSKFKGTDSWFDARDNAVIKCKVFALIMTAGFESSDEIKKELALARSVPDKLFSYFRHENLTPNQKIVLESEAVDLSKQQQHSFGTLQDLVRTAHKVLVAEQAVQVNNQRQNFQSPPQLMTTPATPAQSVASGITISAAIGNFAAFYDQVYGARKIQKVYPSLFTAEEMTSSGKADKICRVLETFKNDKRQLKQALQTIINLHRDYSKANIASLRDIMDGFGFTVNDDLSVTEKKTETREEEIKELVKKYH
jgi:hypothetical protein